MRSAKRVVIAVVGLMVCAVAAPRLLRADPSAITSAYFRSVGGGFIVNNKNGTIALNISLEPVKPLPPDGILVVTFENPANSSQPQVVETTVQAAKSPKGNMLGVESPPVTGMRDNGTYLISVRLYADRSKKSLLGTHDQRVACHQDMLDFARQLKPPSKR